MTMNSRVLMVVGLLCCVLVFAGTALADDSDGFTILMTQDFEDCYQLTDYFWIGDQDVELSNKYARSGQLSVRIVNPVDRGVVVPGPMFEAEPGIWYKAEAWVFNALGEGWLYLEFYDSDGERISEVHVRSSLLNEWEKLEVEGISPAGTVKVRLMMYGSMMMSGVSYWDDLMLGFRVQN